MDTIGENPHDRSALDGDAPRMSDSSSPVVVVVPLRPGSEEQARKLAAAGPPFDPQELPLESHELLLTSHEAVFVFEPTSPGALEALVAGLDVWAAAETWSDVVAGPPRVGSRVYSWHRPVDGVGLGL